MKIILTFSDADAQRLRWLLSNHYNMPRAGLRTLAMQAILDTAAAAAQTMLAQIDAELQAEFVKAQES